jgi:hypothetical protein
MYDEIQDLLYDPIITVGNETLSNSDYGFETYAGTPKTTENTIQYLWDLSTQTEWVMKCEGCGTHQFIDSDRAMGIKGPICLKCGKYLNPREGHWVDMNPLKPHLGETAADKIQGFHLSQLIMPRNVPAAMTIYRSQDIVDAAERRWNRIVTKHREQSPTMFKNEVLGMSDSVGARMISKEELEALCMTGRTLKRTGPDDKDRQLVSQYVAGVDWSGGGTTGISRTALWIWGYCPGDQRLMTMYYEIFEGKNPIHIIDDIAHLCNAWGVAMVLGDAGEGHTANSLLRSKLGPHRTLQIQYGSQTKAINWNDLDRYMADRTTLIDSFFVELKREKMLFADLSLMGKAIDDMLAVFEEVTKAGRKIWNRHPTKPDDCLHAAIFGWVAHKILTGNLTFTQ